MKLLLIDDELTQSNWIRRRLEYENNQVAVSPDCQLGQTMMAQTQYDAVLLHVHRAESEELHLSDIWPTERYNVPLLLIVSPDTSANKSWGLESGADDCVGFPVDSRELHARLYALYRRRAGYFTASSVFHIADLELNLVSKTVHRGGRSIDLLPREYCLLALLLENQGRVVSKKEIVERVWQRTDVLRSNTVEVYINYLRNKIDRQSSVKLIHTVTGLGYVIRTDSHTG